MQEHSQQSKADSPLITLQKENYQMQLHNYTNVLVFYYDPQEIIDEDDGQTHISLKEQYCQNENSEKQSSSANQDRQCFQVHYFVAQVLLPLIAEDSHLKIAEINIRTNPEITKREKVRDTPALYLYSKSEERKQYFIGSNKNTDKEQRQVKKWYLKHRQSESLVNKEISIILYFVEYIDDNNEDLEDFLNNEDLSAIHSMIEDRQEEDDAFVRWKRIQIRHSGGNNNDRDNNNEVQFIVIENKNGDSKVFTTENFKQELKYICKKNKSLLNLFDNMAIAFIGNIEEQQSEYSAFKSAAKNLLQKRNDIIFYKAVAYSNVDLINKLEISNLPMIAIFNKKQKLINLIKADSSVTDEVIENAYNYNKYSQTYGENEFSPSESQLLVRPTDKSFINIKDEVGFNLNEYLKNSQQAKYNQSQTNKDKQKSEDGNEPDGSTQEEDELIYVETEAGVIKEYRKRVPRNQIITEQYLQVFMNDIKEGKIQPDLKKSEVESKYVFQVTVHNLNDLIPFQSKEVIMLYFNSQCLEYLQSFHSIAESLLQNSMLLFAQVNCDDEISLCDRLTLPQYKWYGINEVVGQEFRLNSNSKKELLKKIKERTSFTWINPRMGDFVEHEIKVQ